MPGTSHEAFQVALRNSKQLAYRLYLQVLDAGPHGVTRDDLVQTFTALGVDQSTVTARVRGLVASGLVTDGPDRRPTRKSNPAKVVRAIPGLDFSALYSEKAARPTNYRCSEGEREFLDRCHALALTLKGATTPELDRIDVPKLLWESFCELRKTSGIEHIMGKGFRDPVGKCAWCHKQSCENGCVSS